MADLQPHLWEDTDDDSEITYPQALQTLLSALDFSEPPDALRSFLPLRLESHWVSYWE